MLVGCSHKYVVDPETFKNLFTGSATIIDVSVPALVNEKVYEVLPNGVERFEAGDFIIPNFEYNFPPMLLNFFGPYFCYGCFTEAMILNLALQDGVDLSKFNFYEINSVNKELIKPYLGQIKASIPLFNQFNPGVSSMIPF